MNSGQNGRRVVVTGMGAVSPLGHDVDELFEGLLLDRSGVRVMDEWRGRDYGLSTELASPVPDFNDRAIDRKIRRSMGRVAILAHEATRQAIANSALTPDLLRLESTGVFYGSCMGGIGAIEDFYRDGIQGGSLVAGATSTTFLKIMPHTCAANLAVAFGIGGRAVASSTACAAGTQAIGFGYEAVRAGRVDRAVCGGAEELAPSVVAIFDVLGAVATGKGTGAQGASRPFDKDRGGIVVGEGAATLILEDRDQALARGATVLAEIVGFHTNCDALHMTNPSTDGLVRVMEGALADAGLAPGQIDYVNAHATATPAGDQSESLAVEKVFGPRVPTSSLKGHFGHLMGAAGAIEVAACIRMMHRSLAPPTKNLEEVDPGCGRIDYIRGEPREMQVNCLLKNSFAFGGVNASLVIARP